MRERSKFSLDLRQSGRRLGEEGRDRRRGTKDLRKIWFLRYASVLGDTVEDPLRSNDVVFFTVNTTVKKLSPLLITSGHV